MTTPDEKIASIARRMIIARRLKLKAKAKRAELLAQCEGPAAVEYESNRSEEKCYVLTCNKADWCATCRELVPVHEEYHRESSRAGALLAQLNKAVEVSQ